MSSFTNNTNIQPIPKKNLWITTGSFRFYFCDDLTGDYIEVPEGFEFNGASVPRLFWWFFPPVEPKTINSSCLHDYLYSTKQYSLWFSDLIFLMALEAGGVSFFKRYIAFIGLKLGSWYIRYCKNRKIVYINNND